MNGPILTLLTAIIAALMALGVLGAAWRPTAHQTMVYTAAGLAGLGALLCLISLLLDDAPATLELLLGLPGATFRLTLDPLAGFFAALVFGAGAAALAFTAATNAVVPRTAVAGAAAVACLAGLGLAILATEGLARGTGLAIAGVAVWAIGPTDRASAAQLGISLLAAAAVVATTTLPAPGLPWAALLGPGALAGLVPLHRWLTPAHRASAPAAALVTGSTVPVAIYAMLRMLFDPALATAPGWWGLPLLALGTASVLVGGFGGTLTPDLDAILAAGTVRHTGLTAIGLGIALTARGADLPGVTATALGAVLLLAALQAVCGTLLPLVTGAVRHGAGTQRLDRLGGLVHRMPVTTACLLTGLFGVAALPPGGGFAAIWLLFQALLALPRAGGLPFQLVLCTLAAVLGLAAAFAASGMLRLVGVVCLGRPRTPRAAAADEPTRPARRPLLALAAAATLLGVFVGPFLRLLADAPIRALTYTSLGPHASWLGLAPGAESPGYAALPLASLLLLVAGVVLWLRRHGGFPGHTVSGPAWEGGFAAPPAWLPFGNPATQTSGAGFAPIPAWRAFPLGLRIAQLCRLIVHAGLPRGLPVTTLPAPAVALILAAALLVLSAWAGAT